MNYDDGFLNPEQIYSLWAERKIARGPAFARMDTICRAYGGDLAVPLTEMTPEEKAAVPNLVGQGIDQTATRIASTVPNVLCPPTRIGIKKEETNARKRRSSLLGMWEQNNMDIKLRRRARWLQGYACAPVCIRPSAEKNIPVWYVKDPKSTYPAPDADPDCLTPRDVIYSFTKNLRWLDHYYPGNVTQLKRKKNASPDTRVTLLEYQDANQITLLALSTAVNPDKPESVYPTSGTFTDETWLNTDKFMVIENAVNLASVCPTVIPGRITLDRDQGAYDGIIGMYQAQALLFAMTFRGVANDVFPDQWLVADPNGNAQIVTMADGRAGVLGQIQGGKIETTRNQPGYESMQLINYLERNQRVTAGIPAEFGGESTGNVRTGRRGDSILSAVVDFPIQEAQTLFAKSLEAENRIAVATDKAYYGNDRKSFYVSWRGARGNLDYIPNQIFTTDQNRVFFPAAGVDANNLTITLGQLVGTELMSSRSAREMHPFIDDAEEETDRIVVEGLERAMQAAIEQQAAQGAIPPNDVARIAQLVKTDKMELAEAIMTAQKEAQERQASQAPAGDPSLQPGIAQPGMGAEASPAIPEVTPSAGNLAQVLGSLYPAQAAMA
jgi:hypothetical protein